MADIDYGALFGDVLGETAKETAEPSNDPKPTGEEVKETAEPSGESIEDTSGVAKASPEEEPTGGDKADTETDAKGKSQSKEENTKFAAMRRKYEQERDDAIAKAKKDAEEEVRKQLNESIKTMQMMNPFTRKIIETKEEYDEYIQRRQEDRAKRSREKLGMNEQEYERFVSDLPEVQEAQKLKAQAEAEKKAAQQREFQMRLNEEIKNISMLDPTIKSLEDLSNQDNYNAIVEKVNQGMSIEDAYKLVNFDKFIRQASDKSKQAALNGMNGKAHLQATQSRGKGAIPVPADVKEMYRQLIPGITDTEISEHYNRSHKA